MCNSGNRVTGYKSPALYDQMRSDGFALPSTSTIARWLQAIDLRPGVCSEIIGMIKNKVEHMGDWEKNAVLLFDEMSIKSSLDYDSKRDVIEGKVAFGAMMIVKQFSVHRCQHTAKPVSGSQCFQSMLGASNSSRYVIATQDRELQDVVRSIPGIPLLYLHQHTPHLEEPSPASVRMASEKAHYQFGISKLDDAKISNLKTAVFGEETEKKPRKRKFKSGPNPLSCKKKKKKPNIPENKEKNEDKHKKRKRIKLPQHVKECLINNSQ